ncbi:MAG: FAD:protein FMN transferase [Candidatus Moraniibacteriota bacterium]
MQEFIYKALGTSWCLLVDAPEFPEAAREVVLDYVTDFEKRFSRFLPDSEVNAFRTSGAGEYPISPEFMTLLRRADRLRTLTAGSYDPAMANLLERAGYGGKQMESPDGDVEKFSLPHWELSGEKLVIDGPVAFDLGGTGKGYCIDGVAAVLRRLGYEYFLVDGGGDMVGTKKRDGSAWHIALEYPGKKDTAAGTLELSHQGLAVSDSFRRRWGKWHHIVNPKEKKAVEGIIGCMAVAQDAWAADSVTSGLFLTSAERYGALSLEFQAEYLVFYQDGQVRKSPHWNGELF